MISNNPQRDDLPIIIEAGNTLKDAAQRLLAPQDEPSTRLPQLELALQIPVNNEASITSRSALVVNQLLDTLIALNTVATYITAGNKGVHADEARQRFETLRKLVLEIAPLLLDNNVLELNKTTAHTRLVDPKSGIAPGSRFTIQELAQRLAGEEQQRCSNIERFTIPHLIELGVFKRVSREEVIRTWKEVVLRGSKKFISAKSEATQEHEKEGDSPTIWIQSSRYHRRLVDPRSGIEPGTVYSIRQLALILSGQKGSRGQIAIPPHGLVWDTIPNLIQRGVFTYLPTGEVQRSENPVGLKRNRSAAVRPLSEQISPQEIYETLKKTPDLRAEPSRLGKQFEKDPMDTPRLVAAIGSGVSREKVATWWSTKALVVDREFKSITGLSVSEFRKKFTELCVDDVLQQLDHKIVKLKSKAVCDEETPSEADSAFALHQGVRPSELNEYLLHVRKSLVQIMKESFPGQILIDSRSAEILTMRLVDGLPLESIGQKLGLTRQRIRLILEAIAGIHPRLEAIIHAEVPEFRRRPAIDIEALVAEVRANPEEAFNHGISVNSTPLRLDTETEREYHRRLFFAAFARTYNPSHGGPLGHLAPSPTKFFRALVLKLANDEMTRCIKAFQVTVTLEQVNAALPAEYRKYSPLLLEYLKAVVHNPNRRRLELWQELAAGQRVSYHLMTPLHESIQGLIREQGLLRAQSACAVLKQPWCEQWLPRTTGYREILRFSQRLRRRFIVRGG